MGNWVGMPEKEMPPPPLVLVPPLFDFPPLAARTRMSVPAYELLFGKLFLHSLFEDYFDQSGHFGASVMLKPLEDPHVDLVATLSAPLNRRGKEEVVGNATFRWQRDLDDPHTFLDMNVSSSDPMLQLRSCAYYPKYRVGAFGLFPLLVTKRLQSNDFGIMGVRYGSENLSLGTSFAPFPLSGEKPVCGWIVGRSGRLSAGIHYKSSDESKNPIDFKDLKNWSCAVGYGVGSTGPLCPSFNFALEFARSSQLIASFYQHMVVQRRVNNPFEDDQIVGITNYIDVGFEFATRVDKDQADESIDGSSFQVAASWQANKNFLFKGKFGKAKSSLALAFKSWWRPSFTFSITAVTDHHQGTMSYGFGVRVEDLREPSYQQADPNYVMLTPNKEHLAGNILRNYGKRPMFQADINSGNYDHLPRELKPIGKIF